MTGKHYVIVLLYEHLHVIVKLLCCLCYCQELLHVV